MNWTKLWNFQVNPNFTGNELYVLLRVINADHYVSMHLGYYFCHSDGE